MHEQRSTPKLHLGNVVRCNKQSGCQLVGEIAIISRKYTKTEYWSGWAYKLFNAEMFVPIEIGKQEIELFQPLLQPLEIKN
jgi:hypothetical protein